MASVFESLIANIPAVFYRCKCDSHWTIIYINEAIHDLAGHPSSDYILNKNRSFSSIVHPEDVNYLQSSIHHALNQQNPWKTEYRIITKTGSSKWVSETGVGIFSATNELQYLEGFILDVSDRKKQDAERKEAAAQIIQASKLATLGEMATSVAHELNQPLSVIRMVVGNIQRKISQGNSDPEYLSSKLARIEQQTTRAASIINHMRMFGRKAKEKPTAVDPRQVVSHALELVGEQLRLADITVVTELAEHCPPVLGHSIQMEQVVLNFISNARDAMTGSDGESKITLRVFADPQGVHITTEDTGGGIPEAVLPRIFEPFYTTKDMDKGTGLGLSVSYGIIREMKGSIVAENTNDGARFTITLPALS